MRIFTKEEVIGQWSNEIFRVTLQENEKIEFLNFDITNELMYGDFKVFDNFLILKYNFNKHSFTKTFKIIDLKYNLKLVDYSDNIGKEFELKKTYYEKGLLKQINFDEFDGTIEEIKKELNINTFHFNTAKDKKGNDTIFFRHWDNENRIAVVVKKDFFNELKDNKKIFLTAEKTIRIGQLGYYYNILLKKYDDYEYGNSPFDLRSVYDDYNYNNIHNDYYGFD